jgi:signal transduction histidine kinase
VEIGLRNAFKTELKAEGLNLNLYTKTSLTPALALHVKLLSQILGEFYAAKRREETLKQNTYMHAVYETGARLTHDIKNIVQSMNTLCSAAEHTAEADNDKLLALIRRQLPQLNQRLALTLDKLKAPNAEINQAKPLNEWWQELKQRHLQTQVSFVADDVSDQLIDEEVLTSVVDNLLQNALEKAKHERDIQIQVEINRGQGVCIEVSDTGSAMPKQLAEQLFKKRVKSENGLGIGLYQAGKQAEHAGYDLAVVENKEGEVRFRLVKAS